MVDSVSGSVVTAGNRTFVTGQGSGLNFTALIQAAYDQKVREADRIDVKIEDNQSKIDAYNELRSLTEALENSVSNLTASYDFLGTGTNIFDDRIANIESSGSADPLSFLDISIDPGTTVADYDIQVQTLGLEQAVISDGPNGSFADIGSAAGKGSATFEIGLVGGDTATISFDNNSSLQDIADAFNDVSSTTNVTASIVSLDGGASYQIILEGQDTGADFQYVDTSGDDGLTLLGITDGLGGYENEIQAAAPATIIFEGVPITQPSNTFDTVVQGVEFTIKKETAGETINIDIQNDVQSTKAAIEDFVTAYNELRDFIIQNQQVNADGSLPEGSELFSDSILDTLSSQIQSLFGLSYTTNAGFETLREIGLQFDTQNKLIIGDESALDDALLNDYNSVRQLFESQHTLTGSNEIRIFKNETTSQNYNFTLDITHDGANIVSASVGGDTSLFTISATSINGAEGSIYEGLSFAYIGTTSTSVDVQINNGFADLLEGITDNYSNVVGGTIQNEIVRLDNLNSKLDNDAEEIRDRAERYRDNEIDRLAALEAEISLANILIDQIRAIVDANNSNN